MFIEKQLSGPYIPECVVLRDMALALLPASAHNSPEFVVSAVYKQARKEIRIEREYVLGEEPTIYVDITEKAAKGEDSITDSVALNAYTAEIRNYDLGIPIPEVHSIEDLCNVHASRSQPEHFIPWDMQVTETFDTEKLSEIITALSQLVRKS